MICLGTGFFALLFVASLFHLVDEGRDWVRKRKVSYPYLKMAVYASWFGMGIGWATPWLLGNDIPLEDRWPLGLYFSLILIFFGVMGVRMGRSAQR